MNNKLTETINIRVSEDTRDWLMRNFSARGDVSWVVRSLIEALKHHWEGKGDLSDAIRKAVEETW